MRAERGIDASYQRNAASQTIRSG